MPINCKHTAVGKKTLYGTSKPECGMNVTEMMNL